MSTETTTTRIREITISYKPKKAIRNVPGIRTSRCAFDYLKTVFGEEYIGTREEFNVLFLNRANKPIGIYRLSLGGIDSTVADIRLLFAAALKSLTSGIILSHNHPSGVGRPSESDLRLTKKINEACKLMDIALLDHIILTPFGDYTSMADEGLLS